MQTLASNNKEVHCGLTISFFVFLQYKTVVVDILLPVTITFMVRYLFHTVILFSVAGFVVDVTEVMLGKM